VAKRSLDFPHMASSLAFEHSLFPLLTSRPPSLPPSLPPQVEAALNSRRMLNEAQLRTLTLDQLLEMQENITNIIKVSLSSLPSSLPSSLRPSLAPSSSTSC